MLRLIRAIAILAGFVLLAGCSKTYQVQTDADVPEEVAAAVKGKTLHEGRNQLLDFDTHRLYAEVKDGQIASITLDIDGYAPQEVDYLARMPDPAPNPGDETPQGCEQRKDLCQEKCSERCCMLECWCNFELCKARLPPLGGGGGIGGIRI